MRKDVKDFKDKMPEITYASLEQAVADIYGNHVKMIRKEPVYGGSINNSYQISLSTGEKIFVKMNAENNFKFFTAEALGLWALNAAGKIGVLQVLGMGKDAEKGCSFLLLDYMESTNHRKDYWETFGHELAELHQAETSMFLNGEKNENFGFSEDNFIGSNEQKNSPKQTWIDFFRECRLLPQIKQAEAFFDLQTRKKLDYLLEHLEFYIREPENPSLLHGDLWGGNVLCGNDGKAWLIDPAVYVGDLEADLAMTQLFGSFPATFYEAYCEITPIGSGYAERKEIYNLYHLLNHLNLFGRAYLSEVKSVLNKYIG